MHRKRQSAQLETFRLCEGKARELLARMTVLSQMGRPGRLSEENRRRLEKSGAVIRDTRPLDSMLERDVVTNYHVKQILRLRRELLEVLLKLVLAIITTGRWFSLNKQNRPNFPLRRFSSFFIISAVIAVGVFQGTVPIRFILVSISLPVFRLQ